jgi:hypothetical protein
MVRRSGATWRKLLLLVAKRRPIRTGADQPCRSPLRRQAGSIPLPSKCRRRAFFVHLAA